MIIKRDPDIIKSYFTDESGLLGGHADKVIFPENEHDALGLLAELSSKKIPATISGGGTGVTGGRVPFGGVIIATDRLNKIINIDEKNFSATVQPAVKLSDLEAEASKYNLTYLPDPTEPNAFFGGTVSTNASGAKGFRYGPTRNYIKRLKIVLSSGDILDITRGKFITNKREPFRLTLKNKDLSLTLPTYIMPNIKNASGYYVKDNMDLIDLFIGSEGTLGLVIEADIALGKKNECVMSSFSFFSNEEDALAFIDEAKKYHSLSLEYMDECSLRLLSSKFPNISTSSKSLVYFEIAYNKLHEESIMGLWSGLLEKHNYQQDKSYFADSKKERNKLREFRYSLPELVNEIVKKNRLPKVGTDIAVPQASFREMFRFYKDMLLASNISYVIFGHIGENHMHVNLLPKNEEEYRKSRSIYMDFVKKAVSLGGTVSAEHGIGKLKHQFLEAMYGKKAIMEMAALKRSLDPACILGLGNIFPKEYLF